MSLFQNNDRNTSQFELGKEILKKVKVSSARLFPRLGQGSFSSLFQSKGMEYAESRPYTYGDDARYIDWIVSNRLGGMYSKYFHEDTNKTILSILDCSGSMHFGAPNSLFEIGVESLLIFSQLGIFQRNKVGSLCLSGEDQQYIRPSSAHKVVDKMLSMMLSFQYNFSKINFDDLMYVAKNILKRRSLLIICSDYQDSEMFNTILKISKLHDILLLRVKYEYNRMLPTRGLIRVTHSESQKKATISMTKVRNMSMVDDKANDLWENFISSHNFHNLTIYTHDIVFNTLLTFFRYTKL